MESVSDSEHEWLNRYLSHTKQFTVYHSFPSVHKCVCPDIAQGFMLALVLFIIINDDFHCSDKFIFLLNADDTSIYIHEKYLNSRQNILNRELTHVSNWININRLKLNIMKMCSMTSSLND